MVSKVVKSHIFYHARVPICVAKTLNFRTYASKGYQLVSFNEYSVHHMNLSMDGTANLSWGNDVSCNCDYFK